MKSSQYLSGGAADIMAGEDEITTNQIIIISFKRNKIQLNEPLPWSIS
jgi:hypothetical protein